MIQGHVGLRGTGKSLHAVRRMMQARQQGRDTVANFHCKTGLWRFALWNDMLESSNCLCVIDEAHMWLSSRHWQQNSQADLSYFQQSRKEGVDLIWIAQHENRVEVGVRELTEFLWRHKRIGRFCWARKYVPEDKKHVMGNVVFRITPELGQHYFTEQRIGFRDGKGYGMGKGTAFRRGAAEPVAELDEHYQLRPNYFRIALPWGAIYRAANATLLAWEIGVGVAEWRSAGDPKEPEQFVVPMYRSADGRFHQLTQDGDLIPNEVQLSLFEEARNLAHQLLSSRSHQKVFSANTSAHVDPIAATPMGRAESVATQGSTWADVFAKIRKVGGEN